MPCFTPVLGPAAIVLGKKGLNRIQEDPGIPGRVHAWVGIVIGGVMTFLVLAGVAAVLIFGRRS